MELQSVACDVGLLVKAGQTPVPHRSPKDRKLHWRGRQLPFCVTNCLAEAVYGEKGWFGFSSLKGIAHHGGEDMAAGGRGFGAYCV